MIDRTLDNQHHDKKQVLEQSRQNRIPINPFLGHSVLIKKLRHVAEKIKGTDSPILIQGETGTGKGVLAHWFHENGPRASEIAHKGTVFLDEIGDLDLQIQPKLLKVLEDKQFRHLGSVRDRWVDVRLITATHRDLKTLVRDQRFRNDLFFRINTIVITTPPLRDRAEDIPTLAQLFLERLADDVGVGKAELTDGAIRTLQSYSWPGNIRELRNALERALLLKEGPAVTEADLHFEVEEGLVEEGLPDLNVASVMTLKAMEQRYIQAVVAMEGGRVDSAARRLGMPRSSLYHKLKEYGYTRLEYKILPGDLPTSQ
jgi:DNA-binding NtrC family response regulator